MYSIYSVWKTNNTAKKNLTWFSVLLVSRSFKLRPCFLIQNFGCQAQKITYGSENSKNLTERYLQVLYLITVHEKRYVKNFTTSFLQEDYSLFPHFSSKIPSSSLAITVLPYQPSIRHIPRTVDETRTKSSQDNKKEKV